MLGTPFLFGATCKYALEIQSKCNYESYMHVNVKLPACNISLKRGNTLAITAIVAFVHFTVVADELWETATLSGPVVGLQTRSSMLTVFITNAC